MTVARTSPDGAGTADDVVEDVFLSPEWIHRVARAVELARGRDQYLQTHLADYSLGVTYVIRHIPAHLRQWHGGGSEAVVFVRLNKGTVRRIVVSGKPHKARVDVTVTLDYETAKKLFVGKLRPVAALLSGRVMAKPRGNFRQWPKLAAKSVVTANRVLKIARTVPTVFGPGRRRGHHKDFGKAKL